ncbi:hypothetical protein [Enterococcus faecium]|uniref:hypothetical protein n=1 Tax=Enterococcus faecium TaxID=1352 RepID=UPI002DB77A95|nr:hypothetical protein [Enterococcus faecium]MEB7868906.1 hypothetical protein [Enterococcus faecium]
MQWISLLFLNEESMDKTVNLKQKFEKHNATLEDRFNKRGLAMDLKCSFIKIKNNIYC